MLRKFFYILGVLFALSVVAGGVLAVWGYYYITRDLPQLSGVDDYRPPAVTQLYARDGTLVAEFYTERRYPAKFDEIPEQVRNCFLAAEDASFYSHKGIDPVSILRALYKNIVLHGTHQGASTITQQVVKNLLLSSERTFERKIKEAILAYRLEKHLSKNEILELYLNQIFFGNSAYGIKAAARVYFHKELSQLTLAEAAILAGLPKAPSRYSPVSNKKYSKMRQKYVLQQMVESGFATKEEAEAASQEKVTVYPAQSNNIYHAPYYVTEVRRIINERWRNLDLDTDGLEIDLALDAHAYDLAEQALRAGLEDVDKRRGWRGPRDRISGADSDAFLKKYGAQLPPRLEDGKIYPALVTALRDGRATVTLGAVQGVLDLRRETWAQKQLDAQDRVHWGKPQEAVRAGDVIEVSLAPAAAGEKKNDSSDLLNLTLNQTPEIQGGIVLLDPHSGEVLTVLGGYNYQTSPFNRATQALRQPGSAFKPILYLAAVDEFHYTPSTIVYDQPRTFRVGDEYWTPGNFDKEYKGAITLRTALELSRNLVSADIVSRIGVDAVIRYARKLGIQSPLGRNPSISLGSSEVSMLEMTRAYGVFAAKGVLYDSLFIQRIKDRYGNVLYDQASEALSRAHPAVSEASAFVLANMMKGVVEHGTGTRVKVLKRPIAGKTGTSNEQMDAWFIGYTPEWVAGIWVGFDAKKEIGEKETGGVVAAPIFARFMGPFLEAQDNNKREQLITEAKAEAERLGIEYQPPSEALEALDFTPPEGVEPFWVNKETGVLSAQGEPGAILEYFVKGTEPPRQLETEPITDLINSPEL